MRTRASIGLSFCLATFLATLLSASASAEPTLGLQLARNPNFPIPVTRGDERLAYDITVRNTAGKSPAVGTDLSCSSSSSGTPTPTTEIEWLRNGVPISGAIAATYTVTAVDEGAQLQCLVKTTNDAGGTYAPISALGASRPLTVEPVPTPLPPSGTSAPSVGGTAPAAPEGTATTNGSKLLTEVFSVKGTGDLTPGSKVVKNVSLVSGNFNDETSPQPQVVVGSDIAIGSFTGTTSTTSPNKKFITGVTTVSGALAVGQLLIGPGMSQNTRIEKIEPGKIELSHNANAAGTAQSFTAYTVIESIPSPGELELSSLPTITEAKSGVALSAGPTPFAVGQEISGTGIPPGTTVTKLEGLRLELSASVSGSATGVAITGTTTLTCRPPTSWRDFAAGTATAGSNILTSVVTTEGAGTLTAGSKEVTSVSTTNGNFMVGQTISGQGIPVGAEIAAVGADTLELSVAATQTKPAAVLSAGAQPFAVGQSIEGPGIPPGTTIAAVNDQELTLSANVSSAGVIALWGPATGGTSWRLQWLRNGQPISAATSDTYVVQHGDTEPPSILQCEAIAEDSAGPRAVAVSGKSPTHPAPPLPYRSPLVPEPNVAFNNKSEGKISVEVELPAGTQLLWAADTSSPGVPLRWSCVKMAPGPGHNSSAVCSREDSLEPGASFHEIEVVAQVFPDAPEPLVTRARVSGGGAVNIASAEDIVSGLGPAAPFGFRAFKTEVKDDLDQDFTQAGGHPFSASATLEITQHVPPERSATDSNFRQANGSVRTVRTDVPPGFAGNPQAATKCESIADVVALPSSCPAASVVGGIVLETGIGHFNQPIYAIKSEYGVLPQFAFGVSQPKPGFAYTLTPELRPQEGYAVTLVTAPVQKTPELFSANASLCSFGGKTKLEEASPGVFETRFDGCHVAGEPGAGQVPFISLPTRCEDPTSVNTRIFADTWEEPGNFAKAEFSAPALTGCDSLEFSPTLKARPTTRAADSPSGLEVDLHLPQNQDPEGTATAQLKKTVVTLPPGLVVNPSGANGLGACTSAQIGLGNNAPVGCPDSSKIGTVEAVTPVLDHPLPGTLYIAAPHDNPFNSLLALYLVVEDPQTGTVVKLPGRVEADAHTGRLTTTFDENPQVPIEDVKLSLRGGATAPLRTPSVCQSYSTTSELTPWSAPDSGPPVTSVDTYSIDQGSNGSSCAGSEGAEPNSPSFQAGTASPIAGSFSPFTMRLRREDGSQQFSAVTLTPPPGLLAKLAGTAICSDSALASAAAKSGRQEEASPSCPADSQVGTVSAGAGAGPSPYYASGKVYLTGRYKGAPLSLVIVTPAVAGPFDIGNVVVRTALYIDPTTAQVTAKSDPLPTILEGIPLDIRSATITLDRPGWLLNPTSCDPMAVGGQLTSTLGQTAPLTDRFQVAECGRLGFRPNLKLQLKGGTRRGTHPALHAVLTARPGDANIAQMSVALPHSAFLEQAHIRTICTRVQFAAQACPEGSIYGHVRATSPLVDYALSGPVYLRSSDNPLPDLVAVVRGPDFQPIEVAQAGRIDSVHGGIRNTFETFPDVPISRVVLDMQGGKKGLIVNSRDLCKGTQRATVRMSAQNGETRNFRPAVTNNCKKKSQRHRRQHARGHAKSSVKG
jgi:hypothetical protein